MTIDLNRLDSIRDYDEAIDEEFGDFRKQFQVDMWRNAADRMSIVENVDTMLAQQTITETEPGTILKDFQALLNLIGAGIPVSGTNYLIPAKLLSEFNQQLSDPVQIDLKRPVQKSYPPINGLYLLLRASGLGQITTKGKKPYLVINPEVIQLWNQLNSTEKYFTLLEAWLIRADGEILGERRSALNEGSKCVDFWSRLLNKGKKYRNYAEQQEMNYYPEFHNLALMRMFGLVAIESGKPEAGKGWRIKAVQKTKFGEALMSVVIQAFYEQGMEWESETNSSLTFADLQPVLQPYFPEWQTAFKLPGFDFRPGVYVFKVLLGNIWRRLAISGNAFLDELSDLILESVGFDSDHLDCYTYKNQIGRTVEISHPYADGSPSTEEVRIEELPLPEGALMKYVFDFGDWWEFTVQLEKIELEDPRSDCAEILESYGASPQQYPD